MRGECDEFEKRDGDTLYLLDSARTAVHLRLRKGSAVSHVVVARRRCDRGCELTGRRGRPALISCLDTDDDAAATRSAATRLWDRDTPRNICLLARAVDC